MFHRVAHKFSRPYATKPLFVHLYAVKGSGDAVQGRLNTVNIFGRAAGFSRSPMSGWCLVLLLSLALLLATLPQKLWAQQDAPAPDTQAPASAAQARYNAAEFRPVGAAGLADCAVSGFAGEMCIRDRTEPCSERFSSSIRNSTPSRLTKT